MPRLLPDHHRVAPSRTRATDAAREHASLLVKEEIATMWRFTRNNGITEGFHTKMEVLQRQAYGFRNFNNYRLRVKILCS